MGKQRTSKQQVGVDFRLVIIASLVVGMFLIQLILIESFSAGARKPHQHLTSRLVMMAQPNLSFDHSLNNDFATDPLPPPPFSSDLIDMDSLERQLMELQEIQQEEEEDDDGGDRNQTRRIFSTSSSPPPPPPPSSSLHKSTTTTTTTKHHLSKTCRTRHDLFMNYHTAPAIVHFLPGNVVSVWKELMVNELGFTETDNIDLASFVISLPPVSPLLPSHLVCQDSQVYNHLKGFARLFKTALYAHQPAVHFLAHHPPSTTSSSSSSSSISLKQKTSQCFNFLAKAEQLLASVRNETLWLLHAELGTGAQVDLQKLVDSSARATTTPSSKLACPPLFDETIFVKLFRNVSEKPYLIKVPVYIPTAKPWMIFAALAQARIQRLHPKTNSPPPQQQEDFSWRVFQREEHVSLTVLNRVFANIKIVLGESLTRLGKTVLTTQGRFGYFVVEFLLVENFSRVKVYRVVENPVPLDVSLVKEMIVSQSQVLKQTWSSSSLHRKTELKPEELSLSSFELCAYERKPMEFRIFPFY